MKKTVSILLALIIMLTSFAGMSFTADAAEVSGADIVAYARQYIGYPYQYAKQGPDAFDCSGFVNYVFKHFGINLPVSSYDYWNNPTKYGTVIGTNTTAGAQMGDVVSWYGHVAIYTQNDVCVEARNAKYGVCENLKVNQHTGSGDYRIIRIYGVAGSVSPTAVSNNDIGWKKENGIWYYYDAAGNAKKYWQAIDGKWYYFNSSGVMKTGWLKSGGKWYYLTPSGAMAKYWRKVNGKWYYFVSSGAMKTGWLKCGGKWYFLSASSGGAMVAGTSWQINDVLYTFDASGAMIE